MRLLPATVLAFFAFMFPAATLRAQTVEIQRQVETKLWIHRALQWLEDRGAEPWHLYIGLIALALLLAFGVWRWQSKRIRTGTKSR